MTTDGITGLYMETRNYAESANFWTSLGFEAVFESDHNSGQFRHPSGGPYVFLNESRSRRALKTHPIVGVTDSAAFSLDGLDVKTPFTAQHWDVVEAVVRDADGRDVSLQAPLPEGATAPDPEQHHADPRRSR